MSIPEIAGFVLSPVFRPAEGDEVMNCSMDCCVCGNKISPVVSPRSNAICMECWGLLLLEQANRRSEVSRLVPRMVSPGVLMMVPEPTSTPLDDIRELQAKRAPHTKKIGGEE